MKIPKTTGCQFFITARSNGEVYRTECNTDCGENAGGLWVEIYRNEPTYGFYGDRYDDMCVHPDDCNIDSVQEVRAVIERYINENY